MPTFVWEGRTRNGDVRSGETAADNEQALATTLRQQGITLQKATKKSGGFNFNIQFGTGVKVEDLVIFTRQFATMIDAGLPLVQCLDILGNTTDNQAFGKVLIDVKGHVETGETFSRSLARHPKVFDDLFVNLIAAGETGGILDTIMNRLAVHMEKSVKLKRRLKGALIFPIIIVCVLIGIMAVMMLKVIPVFEKMYKDLGSGSLPAPTAMLISMSRFTIKWFPFMVGGLIGLIIGFRAFLRWPKGRLMWDGFTLGLPVFGPLIRKTVVARFARTLGTLLSSGVPILDAMEIVAKTSGNKVVEKAVFFSRDRIAEGKDMVGPLSESKVFPAMVVQMIGVGEQTGALDAMLSKVADFYEDEVDVAVDGLTKAMEPLIMVVLSVGVGGVVVGMYLPIFSLAGNIKGNQ